MNVQTLHTWVSSAAKSHNLHNYTVELEGQTDTGDGYSSTIYFVKVTSVSGSLHLAIKATLENEKIRETPGFIEACQKEIYIYEVVKKEFQQFLQENNINTGINFISQCYATHITPTNEVLVFDNLKSQDFVLWDKRCTMTLDHVELVLTAYGKWHGLSMALKQQQSTRFQQLTKNNVNMFSKVIVESKLLDAMQRKYEKFAQKILNDTIKNISFDSNDIQQALTGMYFEAAEHKVILHGDCWNNNFLFKLKDNKPKEVRILDWQCSGLGSPVFDLSHFIYCCVDVATNENVEDLLKIYHKSLEEILKDFGCPVDIFPFETLVQHWKRFSRFGLFVSCFALPSCYLDPNDTPNFNKGGDDFSMLFNCNKSDERAFERIRNNFLHYNRNAV